MLGTLVLSALVASPGAGAAEVRGSVSLGAGRAGPVSVALMPLDGQPLPERGPREQVVHLHDGRFEPPYLIARVGDRLRLINEDEVYHVLVAPYGAQPVNATLSKAGTATAETVVALRQRESLYVFCKIHHRTYARIDVMATPLVRMLGPDQRFEFRDLSPGRWRLRVAYRGGDPLYRVITAFTAPPPLAVALPAVPAAASATPRLHVDRVEALFPLDTAQP